jgi:hypothetical protein
MAVTFVSQRNSGNVLQSLFVLDNYAVPVHSDDIVPFQSFKRSTDNLANRTGQSCHILLSNPLTVSAPLPAFSSSILATLLVTGLR